MQCTASFFSPYPRIQKFQKCTSISPQDWHSILTPPPPGFVDETPRQPAHWPIASNIGVNWENQKKRGLEYLSSFFIRFGLLLIREISGAGSTCHDVWNFSLGLGDLGHELLILPIPGTTMLEHSRPSNTNHEPAPIKKEQQKTTERCRIRIPDTSPKRPCRSSWYPPKG